jgi:CRP-like cAMP-binding protein
MPRQTENRSSYPENRLLAALPKADIERISRHMETLHLEMKHMAYEPNKPIEYAYFPLTGVASLVTVMEDGSGVEVATVGNEGMVGLPLFLGVDQTAGHAFTQVPGDSIRIKADIFKKEIRRSGQLAKMMQLYTQALMVQISQGMACNGIHSLRQRCARWLLMTHDRVTSDSFPLSQEFLAQMLGVRRPAVSKVASGFQAEGIIRYSRGVIQFVNREELEAIACECYQVVQNEFVRLLGAPRKQHTVK